jgi:putative membrane protein
MTNGHTIDLGQPRRQSGLAVVFLGLRIVRRLGITQLLVIAFFIIRGASDGRLLAVTVVAAAVLGGSSVLAWWRYTFQLVDRELVVTRGVLRVDRLTVPVERVQSVAIDQELLHRLTGLVKVSVDTAGSNDTEFTIDAIERPVAEALQDALLSTARTAAAARVTTGPAAGHRGVTSGAGAGAPADAGPGDGPVVPSTADSVVFVHDPRRLLVAALTAAPWGALVLLAPLAALGEQLGEQFGDQIGDGAATFDPGPFRWWWLPTLLVAFVLVSIVVNIVSVFLQHWRLTFRAGPDVLRRTSGLLSRTNRASSPRRVQVVTSSQNPLQHRFGVRTVDLSSIGDGDLSLIGCDDDQTRTVYALLGAAFPERGALRRRIERAEIWLAVRNTTVLGAVLAAIGVMWIGWWGLLALVPVPLVWAVRRRHVQTFRWSLDAELASTSHVFVRSSKQAPLYKANAVHVTQSLFERRRGLGRVHLATAAGTVSIGMLPIDTACHVRDVILHAAETDHRPWM